MPNRDAVEVHLGTALAIDGDGHGAFAILVRDETFWRHSPRVHLEGDSAERDVLEVLGFEQTASVTRRRRSGRRWNRDRPSPRWGLADRRRTGRGTLMLCRLRSRPPGIGSLLAKWAQSRTRPGRTCRGCTGRWAKERQQGEPFLPFASRH